MDDGNLTARRTFHRLNLFQGVRPLIRAQILKDVVAGITLSAMNIPQVLGYTRIAGTPVVTGLYTLLLPLVAFATFGSSRYLVVSADSATAAILAGGLDYSSLISYTMMVSSILYFQRNTTGAALISSKY